MSRATAIQWCDSTENPTMGCAGCELWTAGRRTCYAGVLHRRFGGVSSGYAPTFEEVTAFPGRMRKAAGWSDLTGTDRPLKPWLSGRPRLIFVSDMSDALSGDIGFDYLRQEIVEVVESELGRRHRWLWLTKRPHRMAAFARSLGGPWPRNLWPATSITGRSSLGRVRHLLNVGDAGTTRFLSVEPQSEPLDLGTWAAEVDWIIQGGESGPQARPFELAWAEALRDRCGALGVPYFLKQLGSHPCRDGRRLSLRHGHGGDWLEWPEALRVRQVPLDKPRSA